eukprot:1159488-Pelagomonas_calceolata.AAC.6
MSTKHRIKKAGGICIVAGVACQEGRDVAAQPEWRACCSGCSDQAHHINQGMRAHPAGHALTPSRA